MTGRITDAGCIGTRSTGDDLRRMRLMAHPEGARVSPGPGTRAVRRPEPPRHRPLHVGAWVVTAGLTVAASVLPSVSTAASAGRSTTTAEGAPADLVWPTAGSLGHGRARGG